MLDNLRANKGGIITYVFLFAIIIVFIVSFGPGSFDKGCSGSQDPGWAVRVNGETVPVAEYERTYGNLLRNFQQQAGQAFSRELAEQLGLSKIAVEQVVDHALVVNEARKQGLAISDEELARTILEIPGFQVDGKFDREGYKRAVASAYGSESRFEAVLRQDLLYQRMLSGLRETVKVSDAEIKAAWTRRARPGLADLRPLPAGRRPPRGEEAHRRPRWPPSPPRRGRASRPSGRRTRPASTSPRR